MEQESINRLASEIVKRFFQHIEKALIQGEEVGLLGLLLQSHLEDVQMKKRQEQAKKGADREERLFNVLANAPRYIKPLSVQNIKGKEIQKPTSWTKG